jgi:AraC-like DNA-binding protein
MTIPDRVLNIDDVGGAPTRPGQPMLIAMLVPTSMLSDSERQRMERYAIDPGLGAAAWGQSLRDLIANLEEQNGALCEKEERVRGFVLRALAATCPDVIGPRPKNCRRAVKRAKEYVHANFARPFSLEDIARETHISKWHLARSFRNEIGLSIGQYLRQVRAHHSLQMLRAGTKLTAIATELGYHDQAHLTRELRQRFGFTPGQYARAHALPRRGDRVARSESGAE